jgi:hypothetical protein
MSEIIAHFIGDQKEKAACEAISGKCKEDRPERPSENTVNNYPVASETP